VSPESTHATAWTGPSQVPIASQHTRIGPGSSALGAGGPSDWEHFQASFDDAEAEETSSTNAQSHSGNPTFDDRYAELPADLSPASSKRASSAQSILPLPPIPAVSEIPLREHSVSPEPSVEGFPRTGTIDGVIQAWSTPLQNNLPRGESRKSSVSTLDRSRRDAVDSIQSSPQRSLQKLQVEHQQSAFEHDSLSQVIQQVPASPSRTSSWQHSAAPPALSTKTIEVDPYADLGPEYRASLARYVVTLRKEEAAPENERYKIFQAFVLKETRLRSILYGVESDGTEVKAASQGQDQITEQEAVVAKALPVTAASATTSLPTHANTSKATNRTHNISPKLTVETTSTANEESYVVVERDDQPEYSPGGRPRMSRNAPRRTASHPPLKSPPKATSSPSDYAPMVVDELTQPRVNKALASTFHPPPRPGTAPLITQNGPMKDPIKFEPPRPAYTPFRYAEGPQRGSEPILLSRPAYEAYSALRHQSVDSGRVMAQSTANVKSPTRRDTLGSPTVSTARREHEEAFLGLIREKSRVYRKGKQGKSPGTPINDLVLPLPDPVDRQTQVISDLRKIIPTTMPHQRQPGPKILQAEHEMGKYPDVFAWIPETVVAWDRRNRTIRKKQEDERQARQEESEKNIDALFNENEIGYSDIGQLESDFKLAEATRKYDEDVKELECFTDQVFQPVTGRLKEELVQLNTQYIRAVDMLELEADSGSQYIQGTEDHASRSAAMTILLTVYNKLQIRYVKTAEAHYERERRRKKLELSILQTNGDTAAMKKLEQEFSIAERQQALHEARENDTRANKLMDIVDRATVRGLGDNQQFVDDVVAKLQSVNEILNARPENAKELPLASLHETLRAAEEMLDYVATDSKALLTMSNQADNMLNNADYDVSMAAARVANATQESMKTLELEKSKEDERIKAEVDTRLGSVAKGPEHALALVRNIMKRTGVDPQHQDRVQKALEAAKLRNAMKSPVG
jgi:hypothetical protein